MGLSLTPCTGRTWSARRLHCSSFRSQHVFFEVDPKLWGKCGRSGEESNLAPPGDALYTPKYSSRTNNSEQTYLSNSSSSSKGFEVDQRCCSVRLRASVLWDSGCWGWSFLLTDVLLPIFSGLSLLISLEEPPSPKNLLFFGSALCTGTLGACW